MLIKPQGVFSGELLQLMKMVHFTQEYLKAVSGDELTLLIDINMTYLLCLSSPENVISIRLLCCWKFYSNATIQITGACSDRASPSKAQLWIKCASKHTYLLAFSTSQKHKWLGLDGILKLV